ncbi:MAG: ABC transporter substrate-binding protein [Oscillospiraceae bacterium]|jgi:polar amino acid transport system substrate-binding protein|nr:ABC transporter substrate-binding protein [Oscillospiraceae bacterium]
MKRIITLLLAAALIFAVFAGCKPTEPEFTPSGSPTDVESDVVPADEPETADEVTTLTPGTLTVGMEIGYPPMEYLADDGVTPIGFDVDVATELAARLGLELKLEDTAWDAIFTSLDANRYDVIISSVSITPSRQENYNLTRPYISNKLVLITRADSTVTDPSELTGLNVAVQTDTTSDEYMVKLQDEGLVLDGYYVYDKVIQAFDELKIGRVDAVMVDSVVAAYYLFDDSESFRTAWENTEGEPLGLCLKKGNDTLTAAIETVIDEMYADGTMTEIAAKNFGPQFSESVLSGTR